MPPPTFCPDRGRKPLAFALGAPIGLLGGLIGLGGAEFRLPVLVAIFHYPAAQAVALNLAISLFTLAASLVSRLGVTTPATLLPLAPLIVAITCGSMCGAFCGASYAGKLSEHRLERIILVLLSAIGLLLVGEAFVAWESPGVPFIPPLRLLLAAALGIGIGLVSSLLGVAGGELIIPTLVFVFGVDIKLAGTASVVISLPTVMVGLVRYAMNGAFRNRADLTNLVAPMGVGSILGALAGGQLVAFTPQRALKLILGVILLLSALKMFRHRGREHTTNVRTEPSR